jgi:hypothetical protein
MLPGVELNDYKACMYAPILSSFLQIDPINEDEVLGEAVLGELIGNPCE